MSEFRHDPVSDRWVIIAPERAARPTDFPVVKREPRGGFCPFCEGNEDKTPPEITALRGGGTSPNSPGWQVRVVPNRFPAVKADEEGTEDGEPLSRRLPGAGRHEVIVESPRHVLAARDLPPADLQKVLRVYQARMDDAARDTGIAYAAVFKNVGAAAGATLEHYHSQMIATPVSPTAVLAELEAVQRYQRMEKACLVCRMVQRELSDGRRVIAQRGGFVAVAPFASRFPFETWFLPATHAARFERHPAESLGDLADLMYTVCVRLDEVLGMLAYNYLLHSMPFRSVGEAYHWHIELIPRTTGVAGFEWGTGMYINPVAPESAAAVLRT